MWKDILKNNIRDVSIFAVLSNTVIHDILYQALLALVIVMINSLIIPLFKYFVNRIKAKYDDPHLDKIFGEVENLTIDELLKIEEKIKEKMEDENVKGKGNKDA